MGTCSVLRSPVLLLPQLPASPSVLLPSSLSSLDTPSTRRNGPYSYFTSVVRIHELTNWGRRSPRPSMGCIYARSENQCDRAWAAWTAGGLRSTEVPSNCTADWHCRPLPWVPGLSSTVRRSRPAASSQGTGSAGPPDPRDGQQLQCIWPHTITTGMSIPRLQRPC